MYHGKRLHRVDSATREAINCSEISKTVLEKWNDKISSEEMDEIKWHIKEIENSCKKLEDES